MLNKYPFGSGLADFQFLLPDDAMGPEYVLQLLHCEILKKC
jgi:hypothetical protein